MESKSASVAKREVSWSQKLTDFSIVLEEGQKIRVHKHVLAENSEVFEAMMYQELEETKNNEMVLEHFDQGTVISFVEYLYAGVVNDPKTLEEIKSTVGPDGYIYKRSFQREKFTIDLLRMADMYHVEDLKSDCAEYLWRNITDENIIGVWLGAETLGNERLSSTAIKHLVERPLGKLITELPGFSEAFQSCGKPLNKLVDILYKRNHYLKEENLNLKGQVLDLNEKVARLEELPKEIQIFVECWSSSRRNGQVKWTDVFHIQNTKNISTLLQEVNKKKNGKWNVLSKNRKGLFHDLNLNSTFAQENISTNTTLYVWQ